MVDLDTVLQRSDYVVLALPLTPATHRLIGVNQLSKMKPHAWLVNIARGGLVDEDALTSCLDDGAIAGAALDVFATEPLPGDHPMWSRPDVIVTPHSSGRSSEVVERSADIVADNLARQKIAAPLLNIVDLVNRY